MTQSLEGEKAVELATLTARSHRSDAFEGRKAALGAGDRPKVPGALGGTDWVGPQLGEHNEEVRGALGYSAEDISRLGGEGAIGEASRLWGKATVAFNPTCFSGTISRFS